MEINLTDAAKAVLDEYFKNETTPECLRVFLRPRQDSRGRSLALKPDTMTDRDIEFESNGYIIALSRHLASQIGTWVSIDASGQGGFIVTAANCSDNFCQVQGDI